MLAIINSDPSGSPSKPTKANGQISIYFNDRHVFTHTYFVLTTALEDFADRERMLAQDDSDDDFRTRWAAVADELRTQVEAGLERSAPTDATTQNAR